MLRRQCGDLCGPVVEESIGDDDQSTATLLQKGCESSLDFGLVAGMQDLDLQPERTRGLLRLPRIRLRFRIVRVQQAADYRGRGYCLMQRFELFGHDRAGKAGDARNVAARSVEACDETEFDWIAGNRKRI